jgi:hypothetical protein
MSAARNSGSWYLDPVVAVQKKQAHLGLVGRWARGLNVRAFLKTDLFEEANGRDDILWNLFPAATQAIGMDLNPATVVRAKRRVSGPSTRFLSCDVRYPALRPGSVDLIVSTSTLDHLDDAAEFRASLTALAALVRGGGLLIVTMDNLENPLYRPLRWASQRGWIPFRLGYTVSMRELNRVLADIGLRVVDNAWLLHNPRIVTTLLCLALRRVFGRYADAPIRLLLRLFTMMGRLPTKRWTAVFVAACAQVPVAGPPVNAGRQS